MEKDHNFFIQQAIELAIENVRSGKGGPFGALVVKEGQVVGLGVNTVTDSNDPTAHAEVNAIRDACSKLGSFQLDGCVIYSSCEPCPMCLGAVYWARPEKLYFAATKADAADAGFDDSFIYKEISKEPDARNIPFIPILMESAVNPFKEWRKKENKIDY